MAKYRAFTKEELVALEDKFIQFLIVNGITGEDWEKMKTEDPDAAEKMTELFSDVVWESILRETSFLDFRSSQSIKCFQCLSDKIVLIGMDSSTLDLLSDDFDKIKTGQTTEGISVYTTSKEYSKERELELYEMIGWGCELSDGSLFKSLSLLL